ncbi:GNAT family N-acetyltransferase [Ruminococcus flavefaciens]|uniref:GNAT family N-acetyltransferase n=1 Tax=Ruminococcus flavefaciens TaxID=1265 RepID=UPI00048A66F2|nr:GNAT family protein [Ruminococcus flavefaciens]
MKIRDFVSSDAEHIISWISDEREFRLWCADRYERYPVAASDIIEQYSESLKGGRFFPFTAVDDNGAPIGHFILRYPTDDNSVLRLGFVILSNSARGHGFGREMIELAKEYASKVLNARKLTLGVFENNTSALKCYLSAGFVPVVESGSVAFFDENWKCIEMEISL